MATQTTFFQTEQTVALDARTRRLIYCVLETEHDQSIDATPEVYRSRMLSAARMFLNPRKLGVTPTQALEIWREER